jgi:cytochrome c
MTPASIGLAAAGLLAAGAAAADLEYGRFLSAECVTCHQVTGETDGIPSITGWPEAVFVETMEAYQDGVRAHDVMRTIAKRYDSEDLEALAAYFASLGKPGDG